MSTDKDGTQAWYKHGPVYDADANCDVWGIADVPYERGEEQTMLMWVYSEADADRILADHRKAAQAEALAKALKSLPFPRCYDRDCIEVGVNEGNWITFKDGHTEPHKKDCPRYVIHAAANLETLEQSLAHERQQLPALLDELEPAWREAYSDPLNLVRVLQAKAQEATDVFHERQQAEAAEARLDCGLGDFAYEQGEPCKYGPYPNNCQSCRTSAATRRAEAAEAERDAELAKVGMEGHTLAELIAHHRANAALAQAFDAVPISQLIAKLLALAVEQRRALDEVLYELSDDMLATKPKQQARAALATNLDALLAEARELGIDAGATDVPA